MAPDDARSLRVTGDHDVVVVGSGPAGVSAAVRLLDRGLRVLMLDQGRVADVARRETGTFAAIRENLTDTQWLEFLGGDLGGLEVGAHATPKMKIPQHRYVQRGFADAYGITTSNVRATGSLAGGGLSNMWGAGVFAYDDDDLHQYPLRASAFASSFARVAERIGVSGSSDCDFERSLGDFETQPSLPLHPSMTLLLQRHRRAVSIGEKGIFDLGRSRNAVLTVARADRGACQHEKMCLWGCRHDAIYSARHDLAILMRRPGFTFRSGSFVRSLHRLAGGDYVLSSEDLDDPASPPIEVRARAVFLAAGTLGSTIIVAEALGLQETPLRLHTHPAIAFAFVLPRRIGAQAEREGFALGQLAYRVGGDGPGDDAFGVLFAADGVLASDLTAHMPLSRKAAAATARALVPAMVLANCYLPSDYARCTLTVRGQGRRRTATIEADHLDSFDPRMHSVKSRLSAAMRNLGAYLLPGGARKAELGSDGHFAGGIPMLEESGNRALSCHPDGQIRGLPNVFAVDGASLTRLAGKHPTFLIMANADRIAELFADRILNAANPA